MALQPRVAAEPAPPRAAGAEPRLAPTQPDIRRASARAAVAPGEGALRTWTAPGVSENDEVVAQRPVTATACARTRAQPHVTSANAARARSARRRRPARGGPGRAGSSRAPVRHPRAIRYVPGQARTAARSRARTVRGAHASRPRAKNEVGLTSTSPSTPRAKCTPRNCSSGSGTGETRLRKRARRSVRRRSHTPRSGTIGGSAPAPFALREQVRPCPGAEFRLARATLCRWRTTMLPPSARSQAPRRRSGFPRRRRGRPRRRRARPPGSRVRRCARSAGPPGRALRVDPRDLLRAAAAAPGPRSPARGARARRARAARPARPSRSASRSPGLNSRSSE